MIISAQGKVISNKGAVSSEHILATQTGLQMLRKGGNAIDAAVAAAFTLMVVDHGMNGLGGYGGAMVIYLKNLGAPVVVDFTARAPLASTPDMLYKKQKDKLRAILCIATWNAAAGLYTALEKFGTMKWEEVIEPAVNYARNGFVISSWYANWINKFFHKLQIWPESKKLYSSPDGTPLQAGDRFVQKDLADSLHTLSKEGPDVIYNGRLADKMVDYIKSEGGVMAMEDLANWRERHVRILKPAHVEYRGCDIYTPSVCSGGQILVTIMNLLSGFDLAKLGFSSESVHLMLECFKTAFADRLWYSSDPWMEEAPNKGMMSREYADERRELIDMRSVLHQLSPGNPWKYENGNNDRLSNQKDFDSTCFNQGIDWRDFAGYEESEHTASTSVIDQEGNMVALTKTIGDFLGSGVTVPGTGITLNNGMNLFHPTFSDTRFIPNHFNRIEGGKLVMNNMNPFIVMKDGKPFIIGGGSGGRKIITECVELLVRVIDWGMDIQEASSAPRFHLEDREPGLIENTFPESLRGELEHLGHSFFVREPWGGVHAIMVDPAAGKFHAARESRNEVSAAGGLI